MAGGTPRHNALIAAVTIELGNALRGGEQRRVMSTDQRIVAPSHFVPRSCDYLLVAQGAPHVEHFRREATGTWSYRRIEAGGHGRRPSARTRSSEQR